MKVSGDVTCPGCKKDHKAVLDLDKFEPKLPKEPELTNTSIEGTQTQQIQKPIEPRVEIKTVPSADQPFYKCKNCSSKHTNDNYSKTRRHRCPGCQTLNGSKFCTTCNKETDLDDWETLSDDELEELAIPIAEQIEHEHNHHEAEAE